MATEELGRFLIEQCQKRGLSLRRLSLESGLGASTVHGIITTKNQPELFCLNRLADYLGVKRQYLWQLAGLLPEMEYSDNGISDPELRFQLIRADNLPDPVRKLMVNTIKSMISLLETKSGGEGA